MGLDSIPQLAGEFNFSPKKELGLLMRGIIAAATLIYLAMMLATSIAVGTNHDAYEGEPWPPAAAISDVMGPTGLVLMVVAVSAGVLTGLNGLDLTPMWWTPDIQPSRAGKKGNLPP
ncbi:hypothetical protein QP414_10635, partial [Corynebacterium simulans]|nr:hypothetical protein [Corynebacterium simulans]